MSEMGFRIGKIIVCLFLIIIATVAGKRTVEGKASGFEIFISLGSLFSFIFAINLN